MKAHHTKWILASAFTALIFGAGAQDALDCKKDLSYDSKGNFYYKRGDDSKAPVTGNAVCYPKKGMVNRGRLVNGKWDGKVTGYKNDRMVGKAHYKNGVLDGLKVCYTENGRIKDSTIYSGGNPRYAYEVKFDKNGNRSMVTERNMDENTSVVTHYKRVNNMEYVSEIHRFRGKEKDGLQEYMSGSSDAPGSLLTLTTKEEKYTDGELKTITYYDKGARCKVNDYVDGKLSMQNDIGADGNVSASYPLKGGKKHGTAVIYSADGSKPTSAEYSRGKLVTK